MLGMDQAVLQQAESIIVKAFSKGAFGEYS